jgi:hypothetical protein
VLRMEVSGLMFGHLKDFHQLGNIAELRMDL